MTKLGKHKTSDIKAMILRYHRANGIDAPYWNGEGHAARGRTYAQEKEILDALVTDGVLKFDDGELRYEWR